MTSDNLPAVREERAVASVDTDSWTSVVGEVAKLATYIADTEFVPRGLRGKPAAAAAAILYGREVGLPPMTSLTMTHVIEGTPSIASEAMRAMVIAAGHDIEFLETSAAICRVRGRRAGSETWTTVVWAIDMATQAGLTTKSNWKNYPRRMLQARASSELCELVFPDVIHGFKSVEEMEDASEDQPADAFAPAGSSTVQRRTPRKSAAKKAAAPVEQRPERPALAGPPLPGEPGYEQEPAPEAEGEAPDGAGSDKQDAEAAPQAPASDGQGGDAGSDREGESEPPASQDDDVVDAEVVGDEERPTPPRPLSRAQSRMIMASFGKILDGDDREARLEAVVTIVGREVESTNDLTSAEASTLIDTLGRVGSRADLDALVEGIRETEAGS